MGRWQRPGLVCELAGGGRHVFVRISSVQFWVKMQDSQEKWVNGGLPICPSCPSFICSLPRHRSVLSSLEVEIKGWEIFVPIWSETPRRSPRWATPAQQGPGREKGSAPLGSHQAVADPGKGWGQAQKRPVPLDKLMHHLRSLEAVAWSFQ